MAALQAGIAIIHADHGHGGAFGALVGVADRIRAQLLLDLLLFQLQLRAAQLAFHHADRDQMLLDHLADFGDDGGHVFATALVVAAARIEYGFEFLNQEGDVTALAEDGGNDSGQRHDPHEMLHVLGVDEDLEGTAVFILGAGVDNDIVDGDVHGMIGVRRFDLVGAALKDIVALQQRRYVVYLLLFLRLVLRLLDVITGDFLFNLDAHISPPQRRVGLSSRSPGTGF